MTKKTKTMEPQEVTMMDMVAEKRGLEGKLFNLREEMRAVMAAIPKSCRVTVREGGAQEDVMASLVISVQNLIGRLGHSEAELKASEDGFKLMDETVDNLQQLRARNKAEHAKEVDELKASLSQATQCMLERDKLLVHGQRLLDQKTKEADTYMRCLKLLSQNGHPYSYSKLAKQALEKGVSHG